MSAHAFQPALDEGTPLIDTTFVVVDLETTGSGSDASITEIGAVKVRGGEVVGEFQTLVDPLTHIPALIQVLTGITDRMVAGAPRLGAVLPGFLEFVGDAVLVAHNAGFDIGFLKRACAAHDAPWPGNTVIDTVGLARSVLLRDEVPNHKLATLARHFSSPTAPDHRALTDARATVDVLHGLIARIGNLGVHSLEDLKEFTRRVPAQRRAKRTWADGLPESCGVYYFYDHVETDEGRDRRILYVGKSVNVRRRVRSYFTAAETRRRMDEMVRVAAGVDAVVCATPLQAEIVELRMIAQHAPRYNRRSKNPHKVQWLKLTQEAFPRLSAVRKVAADGAAYFGPFRTRDGLERVASALHDAYPIRRCTDRLSPRRPRTACALAELGRCVAPCDRSVSEAEYAALVDQVRSALDGDVRPVLLAARDRVQRLIVQERFEEAAELRSRLEAWTDASVRHHRVASLAGCAQIVAAARTEAGWEIHVIRHGRLAGAAVARPGEVPQAVAREALALAETVPAPVGPQPAGTVEEAERVAAWLERPGVRLIEIDGDWSWPRFAGLAEGELAQILLGPRPDDDGPDDTITA
ncbi:DEDD exonuclease domain-containing protein [Granulicoccus sp. GXG6511]|uniref:DEDD exonuclease domain-containing protein n=1 Tax=Granulicoccus sp. GXG6511 TaxID=3381351 RepID=UPI003D7ED2E6